MTKSLSTSAGLLIALLWSSLSSAETLAWGAAFQQGQLVVILDTTASPKNLVIEELSFNASFFGAGGRALGKRNVLLPAGQIQVGQRNVFTIPSPFAGVQRVETDNLFARWHAAGYKSDGEEIRGSESVPAGISASRIIPPPPSLGTRCDAYGRRAAAQNSQNMALSCGYTGTRWSDDVNMHSQWCSARPQDEPEAETIERDTLLRQCARMKARTSYVPRRP